MILIKSKRDALKIIENEPNKYNVVSLRGTAKDMSKDDQKSFQKFSKDMIVGSFDDIFLEKHTQRGYVLPDIEQIRDILNWAKDKEDILVHCYQGVSRSSATALSIACMKYGAEYAVKLLNANIHKPNELILVHACEVLDSDEVYRAYEEVFIPEYYNVERDVESGNLISSELVPPIVLCERSFRKNWISGL